MKRSAIALASVLALGLGLSACETATPYQPATPNAGGGFTDQKVDDTHFTVTFQGNSVTSRKTVENYLLYRAAELTVKQGFDWFEMVDRKTHNDRQAYVAGPYWEPYWHVHHRGWLGGGAYWGDPYWGADIQTIDRYEAEAEVAIGQGPKPASDPKAFDAHQVMANLGPTIVRPS
jgi:hypothetical protein